MHNNHISKITLPFEPQQSNYIQKKIYKQIYNIKILHI